jgi:hypothetical protein
MVVKRTFTAALVAHLRWPVTGCQGRADGTPEEAKAIAAEAYIYGCSLISVEVSRKVITNVASVTGYRHGDGGWTHRSTQVPTKEQSCVRKDVCHCTA